MSNRCVVIQYTISPLEIQGKAPSPPWFPLVKSAKSRYNESTLFSTESCGIAVKQLVFERSAIKHNTAIIQERAGSAVIFAVLVGDAYGARSH